MSENIENTANAAAQASEASAPAKKKSRKKGIIWGTVAVVVVAAVIGMWAWHNTPGFCGTMCHNSMNAYLATYNQDAGVAGTDKYGNAVSDTDAMLVVSHKTEGLACLDCHVPTLSQQIGEAWETVTGNYYVVNRADGNGVALIEVGDEDLVVNSGGTPGTGDSFCLRSGCHVTASGEVYTRETLTELTADLAFNPHDWEHGYPECSECHKSHRASVLYCTRCHYDAYQILPDGWVTYDESVQILQATLAE